MAYRYKVVPFIGQSRGSLSAAAVAIQLESVIADHASRGWEFCQLSDVNIEVQPGCIGSLFGATVQYVRFDQLIFRGDEHAEPSPSANSMEPFETNSPSGRRGRGSFQPEVLSNGKIKCWNCGEANNFGQENCWDCYSPLYDKR